MSRQFEIAKTRTLDFTARFGFVTKSLFNDHLSNFGNTQNFRFWNKLFSQKLLIHSKMSKDVAYLSAKSRALIQGSPIPSRSIYMIPHDIIVAEFILNLKKSGLVKCYWTEYELKTDIGLASDVMGSVRIIKYPDLVVELKTKTGSIRLAVEIERSQKTHSRYSEVSNGYLRANKIDLIIFGTETVSIKRAVLKAFDDEIFIKAAKIPATFLLSDFEKMHFQSNVQFLNLQMSFQKMILSACQLTDSSWNLDGISIPDSFQFKKNIK